MLGDPDDVEGFALLGVEGRTCRTTGEIDGALGEALRDPDIALVLVSPGAAARSTRIARLIERGPDWPVLLVLP